MWPYFYENFRKFSIFKRKFIFLKKKNLKYQKFFCIWLNFHSKFHKTCCINEDFSNFYMKKGRGIWELPFRNLNCRPNSIPYTLSKTGTPSLTWMQDISIYARIRLQGTQLKPPFWGSQTLNTTLWDPIYYFHSLLVL